MTVPQRSGYTSSQATDVIDRVRSLRPPLMTSEPSDCEFSADTMRSRPVIRTHVAGYTG